MKGKIHELIGLYEGRLEYSQKAFWKFADEEERDNTKIHYWAYQINMIEGFLRELHDLLKSAENYDKFLNDEIFSRKEYIVELKNNFDYDIADALQDINRYLEIARDKFNE